MLSNSPSALWFKNASGAWSALVRAHVNRKHGQLENFAVSISVLVGYLTNVNPIKVTDDLRAEIARLKDNPARSRDENSNLVLSVEDDESAYSLIRSAFDEVAPEWQLERASNGEEALAYLLQSVRQHCCRPNLILVNMNMPRMSGPELLAELRRDEALRDIPTVVFSSS